METQRPQATPTREDNPKLVGRDAELGLLGANLAAVVERRDTRIVTVVGPAGIGKTRLVAEFVARRASPGGEGPRAFVGSARDGSVSFAPFTRLFRSRFGLVRGMDPEVCRNELRRQLEGVLEPRRVSDAVTFLGQLLGLPDDESPLTRAVSDDPHEAELVRRAVVKAFLETDAQETPLVLVLEDLHEAHEDALSLLRYLLEYLTGPILVICTGRDDLVYRQEDWARIGERRHTLLELAALSGADAASVARSMLAPFAEGKDVPEPLVETACAFAQGNPGLIAQMVEIYRAEGVIEEIPVEDGGPRFEVRSERLETARLPATVEDAVIARVTSLDEEERMMLEQAAAMGAVFWSGAFVALARTDQEAPDLWVEEETGDVARIGRLLDGLARHAWVIPRAGGIFPGSVEYTWSRSEEREAIAARTSPDGKALYNRVIADWMEHQAGVRTSEERIAALARHREQAGESIEAGLAYLDAAAVARRRYANGKAC